MYRSYFFYIAKSYTKYLIVLLLGITVAVTLIDYMKHVTMLKDAGNQMILYIFYTWQFRLSQFYPLAMVFAAILTYMSFVQSARFVSLLSFGYSKKRLFFPFILPAVILYIVFLCLQLGDFSYARERAWEILHQKESNRKVDDLFFKHNHTFVYVKELDPIAKVLKDVTVFILKGDEVVSAILLKKATFDGRFWVAEEADVMQKKYTKSGVLSGFKRETIHRYKMLEGYKPKVIELIYEGESLSLLDAIQTYGILREQHLDTNKIKASFYGKVLLPLFAFFMISVLFFKTVHYVRYMNRELVWAVSLGGTLLLWGMLYVLYSLGSGGTLSPDIAIALPIGLLMLYTFYLIIRGEEKLA